jgi:crotonobetainyl-CoA:carnitine CoA-transferase CaiB-like acyl-CoA transferase
MSDSLEGIRILDLSQLYPGPYCTMILADLGAEVIKVEPVNIGDFSRLFPFFFDQINRNKKSIALNLKDPRAQDAFHRLARGADVVIEGFRPGTTARLGVDYATLKAINPRLIYCSISGFGQDGPYVDRPGHDINYMSLGGTLGLTRDGQGKPMVLGLEVVDLTSGMNAAIGILASLLARQSTGEGQFVDISMLDTTISLIPMEVGYCLGTGEEIPQNAIHSFPHYGIFETSDGNWLVLGIVHEDWFWRELCNALEMSDISDLNPGERIGRKEELVSRLKDIFITRTLAEWMEKLQGYDIPFSKVNSVNEALEDPQVVHRGMVVELPGGEKSCSMVGSPYKLSVTPPRLRFPSPKLGENADELLKEAGMGEEEIRELRDTGAIK